MQSVAVYVHTPFCPSKCGYCDFNSYAMSGDIMARTTDAMIREIEASPVAGIPAKTIFVGGGTPTFLPVEQLVAILDAVRRVHPPVPECEITSEANPGTVDAEKFDTMRSAGFNRISLGAQSFVNEDLIRLDRVHKASEIVNAVGSARSAGFDNVNIDLMFALPGQSVRAWEQNLRHALELETDHLSLYCLTIEPNTVFYKKHLRGQLDLPDDDAQVEMYDLCVERCEAAGLKQYEISNFSLPGKECAHNLCYWHAEPYAGYGPGAVGCLPQEEGLVRYTNLKHPERYCAAIEEKASLRFESELLSTQSLRLERIMLGLRLNDGLPYADLPLDASVLRKLSDRKWIEPEALEASVPRVRLSPLGRHYCSEVALELS